MKSLVVSREGNLSVEELPIPGYKDWQVLLKLESCGICNGTDLKLIHGNFKGFDNYPAVLGHEGVGRVVEKGRMVKNFKLGDLILLPFLEGVTGGVYPGWGAFSEYAVAGDWRAMAENGMGPGTENFSEAYYAQQVVPEGIDAVGAAMIVTFREVLSAMKRFGFKENKSLVVFGAGPVGLCFIKFAKLIGMGPVIAFDIIDEKLREASVMGADFAFNSRSVDVKEAVKRLLREGADFVADAVGMNQLINQSMEFIRHNGKICSYGISPKLDMTLDWSKAPYNWTLQFIQWPSKLEESEAHLQIVNWIRVGVLDPYKFISDVIPFERVLEAFGKVKEKKAAKKIVIKF